MKYSEGLLKAMVGISDMTGINEFDIAKQDIYQKFSDYLKIKYGSKVYKLPVAIPVSCPGRQSRSGLIGKINGSIDSSCNDSGCSPCIFCGEEGAGFEMLSDTLTVTDQLKQNSTYIGDNYKAKKFIAYFQNYSNTYLPLERFKEYMLEACIDNIVAIYISTRPDCINERYLEFLSELKRAKDVDVVIELGLQTVNYHSLDALNRNHGLAEFIDAVLRIKKHGLETCAHYIVDLPMDSIRDAIEGARIISALGVEQVKCHSLFILKNTPLGDMYEKGEIAPVDKEEYINRIITFLEHLDPAIIIQRLTGRAPADRTLFCNWDTSWWKLQEMVEHRMKYQNRYQGRLFNYLNGQTRMKELL